MNFQTKILLNIRKKSYFDINTHTHTHGQQNKKLKFKLRNEFVYGISGKISWETRQTRFFYTFLSINSVGRTVSIQIRNSLQKIERFRFGRLNFSDFSQFDRRKK